MVMVYGIVAKHPLASVPRTAKALSAAVVGVPLTTPAAVSVSPVGKAPAARL